MKILKHKDLNYTVDEIVECLENDNRLEDTCINITFVDNGETVIVVEPIGLNDINLFGDINEDYELIYFEEE